MRLIRSTLSLIRTMLSTCTVGIFGYHKVRYPEIYDEISNEYLDEESNQWYPLFMWWDKQLERGREVPCDHVDVSSMDRMHYVTMELKDIEHRKRQYYSQLVRNRVMQKQDTKYIMEEWYLLREQILIEEQRKAQVRELDYYCQICFERINNAVMIPCQHEICDVCYEAIPKREECPFCRGKVSNLVIHEVSDMVRLNECEI